MERQDGQPIGFIRLGAIDQVSRGEAAYLRKGTVREMQAKTRGEGRVLRTGKGNRRERRYRVGGGYPGTVEKEWG